MGDHVLIASENFRPSIDNPGPNWVMLYYCHGAFAIIDAESMAKRLRVHWRKVIVKPSKLTSSVFVWGKS